MNKKAERSVSPESIQGAPDKKIRYYDPAQPPFSVYGVMPPDDSEDRYRRMPAAVAAGINEVTRELYANTSGGRIRFCTNSRHIVLKAHFPKITVFGHFARSGVAGFSVYAKKKNGTELFSGVIIPDGQPAFEGSLDLYTAEMREITICMPLYNNIDHVRIGIDEASLLMPASGYAFEKPVVFYGSSITQGACASRPGSEYPAILSRRLNFDYINLGFSGGARGEPAMAEYIKTLPMQAFVMDYDHNAPSPNALSRTHEPFFQTIRSACPLLPIILVSRPCPHPDDDSRKRFAIIRQTYENALQNGDRNICLIDGSTFFAKTVGINDPTVDLVHPTDLGFYLMAQAMEPCLRAALHTKQTGACGSPA